VLREIWPKWSSENENMPLRKRQHSAEMDMTIIHFMLFIYMFILTVLQGIKLLILFVSQRGGKKP
jgi:hypothetical protein